MLAGHITLKVFAGFIVDLSALGPLGMAATIAPLLMAVIQAYVFTMLTCMYLNDAVHPVH